MGKKTNWTLSEDQALCRSWLCASDATLSHAAGGDQKAGTFWGLVHQLFHNELETSVDRPVTGLKIRWTRINRDVQRFAIALARVQASHAAATATTDAAATINTGESDAERGAPDAELERERQAIDEAIELFLKEQGSKFTFESCWRLLRFSPRWMQLLANSAGVSASAFQSASASPVALLHGDTTAGGPLLNGSAAAAIALQKRRLGEFLGGAHGRVFPESSVAYLAAMAQELARQSDLMEEQNAIALFRMELDLIEDDVARDYFTSLRHTYAKRMRREEPKIRDALEHADVEARDGDTAAVQGEEKETAAL